MDDGHVEEGEMFDGLTPAARDLLHAAGSDLPAAQPDAGLLRAMAEAIDVNGLTAVSPIPRRKSMLGKALTAKALAVTGALLLTGGVASAATGTLPDPAQDVAADAASVVGLNIPKSDAEKQERHPENHGKDVSGVAHDKEGDGEGTHGSRVCAVASEGKCKSGDDDSTTTTTEPDDTTDTTAVEQGKSGDHRQDEKAKQNQDKNQRPDKTTTSTTVNDDSSDE
jgi:hypothetical protein